MFIMLLAGVLSFQSDIMRPKGEKDALSCIIDGIRGLEDQRDPKCHATATRLLNFMYGTPLSEEARFKLNDLQKELITSVWRKAGKGPISMEQFTPHLQGAMGHALNDEGDARITLADGSSLTVSTRDIRHYGSVAFSLRAILAVQQEAMLSAGGPLPVLDDASVEGLKQLTDLHTLAALSLADTEARGVNMVEIDPPTIEKAWRRVSNAGEGGSLTPGMVNAREAGYPVLSRIIDQKIASYQTYNKVSQPLFWFNISAFFARHDLPEEPRTLQELQENFGGAVGFFAGILFRESGRLAQEQKEPLIRERHVDEALQMLTPFVVNEFEDVTYFHHLDRSRRVILEAYDTDAFRDSGLHWIIFKSALQNPQLDVPLEADPFAAELIAEGIAQFGVLVFRLSGIRAKQEGAAVVNADHLRWSVQNIRERSQAHAQTPPPKEGQDTLVSAGNDAGDANALFSDVTQASGVQFQHRSADWLARFMRSYLYSVNNQTEAQQEILDHPPTFSGSGVAAEDINADGLPDILLVGGKGNRLFLNKGKGVFEDITQASGIVVTRKDNTFGEPRQPLIADFDNDGKRDILITYVNDNHQIFRNLGNARFENVSAASGLGGEGLVGGPATVFDYDNDGLLDVYIGYFGNYLEGVGPNLVRNNFNALPDKLFRNQGNFSFKDVTKGSGLNNLGWSQAVGHTDLNGDGLQDVIVGNDFGINGYYVNQGGGRFIDKAGEYGTDLPSNSMNVGLADLNRDGAPDIYISNIVTLVKDESYVMPTSETRMKLDPEKLGQMRIVEANHLFMSDKGDKGLRYALSDAVGRGKLSTGWAWDADFFDADNDGDDDLYCVNGLNEYRFYRDSWAIDGPEGQQTFIWSIREKETNVFFLNQNGKLENKTEESGAGLLGNSRSAAYLDMDNDGDLDMVLNNFHAPAVVYRNNAERRNNNWLKLDLVGDPAKGSNRDAVGARVLITPTGGQIIWREVSGSIGYLSQHPKQIHVGVGTAKTADITIHWPGGEKQELKGLSVNTAWQISQGQEASKAR